jgi:hypothetical protein
VLLTFNVGLEAEFLLVNYTITAAPFSKTKSPPVDTVLAAVAAGVLHLPNGKENTPTLLSIDSELINCAM